MSEPGFLKCPCQKCGNRIAFPEQGVGAIIDCPHCGQKTMLVRPIAASSSSSSSSVPPVATIISTQTVPSPPPANRPPPATEPIAPSARAPAPPPIPNPTPPAPAPRPARRSVAVVSAILIVAVLAIGGAVIGFLKSRESDPGRRAEAPAPASQRNVSQPKSAPASPSPAPAPGPESSVTDTSAAAGEPKSIDDLKTGGVNLEKAPGTSLVYAVGHLTNASPHPRYGVTIEVALTDGSGKPAGIAKDYRQVLDPGESWKFRALILDSRAKAGSVNSITEEP